MFHLLRGVLSKEWWIHAKAREKLFKIAIEGPQDLHLSIEHYAASAHAEQTRESLHRGLGRVCVLTEKLRKESLLRISSANQAIGRDSDGSVLEIV